jgi:hypothetical protein
MFRKIPKNVLILGLVSFFNDIASEMSYPIVPLCLTRVLNAPVEIVGLVEGFGEGSASVVNFVFGYWSDRVLRRKIFVISGYATSAVSKLARSSAAA